MKVAVWDSYVKKNDGSVCHFDIIVPEEIKDTDTILRYGEDYLKKTDINDGQLSTDECQFCHFEEPDSDMLESIMQSGYYILEMEDIPAILPDEATRRDMILHLRAHRLEYRFFNFRGMITDDIRLIIEEKSK